MDAVTETAAESKNIPAGPPATALKATPARTTRRPGRLLLMLLVPTALVLGGGYFWLTGGRYEETENASLRQARVTIASVASGRVADVRVHDNEAVKAGDTLFVVDPEPYRIALTQADAALAAARLNVEQLRASHQQALAQERVASNELDYMRSELDRQKSLAAKGVSAQSALDTAERNLNKAIQEQTAAADLVMGTLAALGGNADIPTDEHPTVLAALAAREKAAFDLSQTTVKAPADGIISQASAFKTGQFVSPGTPLFSLVDTRDTWIEANFKETQLTNMRVGQKAEVTLDTFPDHVFEATIDSIGAGTGAEFSLLPAQNATGNWVKVTQRIPVRLTLDTRDAGILQRTGMSATVTVDTEVSRSLASLFGSSHAVASVAE